MILQSDLSEVFGKRHKSGILSIDMLHAVANGVAYVKMMGNACILKAALRRINAAPSEFRN